MATAASWVFGQARQSSTGYGGDASRAIDGNTSGTFGSGGQTHTAENQKDPWWELDLLVEILGFAMEAKFGNFERKPFGSGDPKQIVVCRPG